MISGLCVLKNIPCCINMPYPGYGSTTNVQPSLTFRHMCLHGVVVGAPWQNKAFYSGWSDPQGKSGTRSYFCLEMPIIRNCAHCPWLREVHLAVTVNMRGVGFRALLSIDGARGGTSLEERLSLSPLASVAQGGGGWQAFPLKPMGLVIVGIWKSSSLACFLIHCNWWHYQNAENIFM